MSEQMARRHFGYGTWEAPYWFIGPEEGKGRDELADNTPRVRAWEALGSLGLSDCKAFHRQLRDDTWHRDKRPPLQSTWRPLLLLLHAFLGASTHPDVLRTYQRDRWGQANGETCLIELSGSAAKSLNSPVLRRQFLDERIHEIRSRLLRHQPTFVVMYGYGEESSYESIAGRSLARDGVVQMTDQRTMVAFPPHPQDVGRTNAHWLLLAEKLREKVRRISP